MKKNLSLFVFLLFPVFVFAIKLDKFSPQMSDEIVYGKSSKDIKQLQIVLNQLGYDVATSGPESVGLETEKFDNNLFNAIKGFQKENELNQTGKFDSDTLKAINQLVEFGNNNDLFDDTSKSSTDTASTTPDVFDTYGSNDPDMNKDYFSDGVDESRYTQNDSKNTIANYVGSAIKTYTGIDITGKSKVENPNNSALANNPESILSPIEIKSTGNFFQDIMLKAILNDASRMIYGALYKVQFGYNIVTPKKIYLPSIPVYTQDDVDKTIKNVTKDGEFDPFACLKDPICAKF